MTRRLPRILLGFALLCAALAVAPAAAGAACGDQNTQPNPDQIGLGRYEASVYCLVNEERADHGLPALGRNDKLDTASQRHSTAMRWGGFFSHDSLDGSSFIDRILATGYIDGAASWAVGENIAWGSLHLGTPKSLVFAWMHSPGHRANILSASFNEIGVGADWGSPLNPRLLPSAIVTTDFGTIEGAAPAAKAPQKKGKKKRKHKRKHRNKKRSWRYI